MRGNTKRISRTKLLAAVLAVNGFAFYAAAQDSTPPNAGHNLSQGVVVPGSQHVQAPSPANSANNNTNPNATNTNTGIIQTDGSRLMPDGSRILTNGTRVLTNGNSVLSDGSVISANGTVISGPTSAANGGSVNNTGVFNPNVNPNSNVGATPAGATLNPDGTTTLNNGATIDTSERGTARGTVNSNGTVNNGAAGAGNSDGIGAGAANSAGVGAANSNGVGAGNSAGAGAANSAGAGAANSAGAGASNSAGAGASNSAGAGAGNSAGAGAANSAGAGAFGNVPPAGSKANNSSGSNNSGNSTSGSSGSSGAGHVDASSVIPGPIYLDDLSVYSRPKPNKDTPDTSSPHADQAIPSSSNNLPTRDDTLQQSVNGQPLSYASDSGQVRMVLARTTEDAISKDNCQRLSKNFDKIDRNRLDFSQAKFDDLNARIDQFNQDWREKYGRDFAISQPEMVFNDEYRFMPSGLSADTARTASYSESAEEPNDNPTGQLLPRDATYHDGTKMKADGTIQRNDITTYNSRPGQVNVPTGNSINDRDPANHDRPDPRYAAQQRDVIDASAQAQQSPQRIERAYDDTTTRTQAKTDSSVDLRSGQTAEIDSRTGAVRRDVAGSAQTASDVTVSDQQTARVERAQIIIPASHGLAQLSVPMIKEDGQWKLCVPDNMDSQKLHDCLLRHISMMDDQKATWPTDVNDAQRMASHHILAAIYDAQQKSAPLSSDAEK